MLQHIYKKESLFRLSCDPPGARTQDPNIKKCCALPTELANLLYFQGASLKKQCKVTP